MARNDMTRHVLSLQLLGCHSDSLLGCHSERSEESQGGAFPGQVISAMSYELSTMSHPSAEG